MEDTQSQSGAERADDERRRIQEQRRRTEIVFLPEDHRLIELDKLNSLRDLRKNAPHLVAICTRFVETLLKHNYDEPAGSPTINDELPARSIYWFDLLRQGAWEPGWQNVPGLVAGVMVGLADGVKDTDSKLEALLRASAVRMGKDPKTDHAGAADDADENRMRELLEKIAPHLSKGS